MKKKEIETLIERIETIPIGDGDLFGERYTLLPYQKAFIRQAFKDGIIRSGLSLARGGGKSGLGSALGAAGVLGYIGERGFDTAVVASSFSQAAIIGRSIKASLELMGFEFHSRRGDFTVHDSTNKFSIEHNKTKNRLQILGSDSKRSMGLRFSLGILDEGSSWVLGGEKLYAAMKTALGKRRDSRLIAISTRAESEEHWLERLLKEKDPSVYSAVYSAPLDADPFSEDSWRLANPAMDQGLPHIEVLRAEARLARTDPAELQSFKALRLNQGVSDITRPYLLDPEEWRAAETDDLPPAEGPYCLGLDVGETAAFSACSAYWQSGRLEGFQCAGNIPDLAKRGLKDGVGSLYERMHELGEIVLIGNRVPPPAEILRECVLRWGVPKVIAADRFKQGMIEDAIRDSRLKLPYPTWRGQGFRDGDSDLRDFSTEVLEGRVAAPVSLAMRSAFGRSTFSFRSFR